MSDDNVDLLENIQKFIRGNDKAVIACFNDKEEEENS